MRHLLTILMVITFILPVALADNCSTGHAEEKSSSSCPYMQAKASGDTSEYTGKVCPVTGKKAEAESKSAVCPVTGKTVENSKVSSCSSSCAKTCCSKANTCSGNAKGCAGSCAAKSAKCTGKAAACCGSCKSKVETKAQTVCPVMGRKVNKEIYVDHDGKRVYLCCKGCVSKVKADPEKYIEMMEKNGITLDTVEQSAI